MDGSDNKLCLYRLTMGERYMLSIAKWIVLEMASMDWEVVAAAAA